MFNRNTNKCVESGVEKLPVGATKYVIADPCRVMADYHCWELCDTIPVALDKIGCWSESVMLPSDRVVYNYLDNFKYLPKDFREIPLTRTLVKYDLSKEYTISDKKTGKTKTFPGCSMWLFPTGYVYADDDWQMHMTPDVRKDIAKRMHSYNALRETLKNMQNSR